MNYRTVFFVLFCVMALGTYFFIEKLNKSDNDNKIVTVEAPPQVEMLVFWKIKRKLNKGELVHKELFERAMIAKSDAMQQYGISNNVSISLSNGSVLNRSLSEGEMVLPEYISYPDEPGYLNLITPENQVIYALQVSNENLIPNYISTGDLVDIISIRSLTENISEVNKRVRNIEGLEAKVLKRRAKVLFFAQDDGKNSSVFSVLGEVEGNALSKNTVKRDALAIKANEKRALTSIILAVEPDDVTRLSLAKKIGQLEIYPSQTTTPILSASITDVVENTGMIRELRGDSTPVLTRNSDVSSQ